MQCVVWGCRGSQLVGLLISMLSMLLVVVGVVGDFWGGVWTQWRIADLGQQENSQLDLVYDNVVQSSTHGHVLAVVTARS